MILIVNGNMLDEEFKGNVLILETGKIYIKIKRKLKICIR